MGAWRGKLNSTAGRIDVVLLDYDNSGVYNDAWNCGEPDSFNWHEVDWGDCVFADTTGCGMAATEQWCSHSLPQGGLSNLGGSFYTVKATETGNRIDIELRDVATGTLLVQAKNFNGLDGSLGFFNILGEARIYHSGKHDGSPVVLPAGKYLVGNVSFSMEGEESDELRMGGKLYRDVEVKPNQQTTLVLEGQLGMEIMPDLPEMVVVPGEETDLGWEINVGDVLSDAYINTGTCSLKPPSVRFDDGDEIELKECSGGG